jgi:hypothetical protein
MQHKRIAYGRGRQLDPGEGAKWGCPALVGEVEEIKHEQSEEILRYRIKSEREEGMEPPWEDGRLEGSVSRGTHFPRVVLCARPPLGFSVIDC